MGSLPNDKVPVIDFTKPNLKPGTETWLSTSKEVIDALHEHGYFVVEHNKVPLDRHEDVFGALEEIFDLPLETKRKSVSDIPFYGYFGKRDHLPDLYESFGIGDTSLEGIQDFATALWPQGNDSFCKKVYSFVKLEVELEQMVMRMVFESYGLDSYETHEQEVAKYLFRMMRYRRPREGEDKLGVGLHTDKSFLTVIYQNNVNGVEVKSKDGQWVAVDPSPSSFVVMAGETIRAWSNGRIMAPIHKVVMREDETRYSMAMFSHGKGIIKVPEKLVDENHPLKFKPFDNFGLLRYFSTPEGMAQECALTAYCGI